MTSPTHLRPPPNDAAGFPPFPNPARRQAPGHESYADLPSKPTQYPAGSSGVKGGRAGAGGRGGRKKWPWVVGALVLVAIILGAVLGGVLGSRAANNDNNKNNSASGGNANAAAGGGTSGAQDPATRTKGSGNEAVVPTATDAFGNPLYPTTTGSAVIAQPTVVSNAALQCPAEDTSGLSLSNPKKSHPLLIATETRWNCLPALIAADSYMSYWNDTVFLNASRFADMDPVAYVEDGGLSGSGVLDPAREVQLRIKHWAYAYKLSNDTKWVDRTWRELQVASGNTSTPFGQSNPNGDIWNCQSHFLDCAEFTEAFALAYDWMYEAWTAEQRTAIMWSILNQGLSYGLNVFEAPTGAGSAYQWWSSVDGNWNCVCNKGMTMGALAIINEDPTNRAKSLLGYTVPNANAHCAYSPSPDGTWSETANYWYFGTYSHVEMAASLLSATGSTQNLLDANPGMKLSATYHMYVTGLQGLFNYGDAGPNKYTATANGLMFYGQQYGAFSGSLLATFCSFVNPIGNTATDPYLFVARPHRHASVHAVPARPRRRTRTDVAPVLQPGRVGPVLGRPRARPPLFQHDRRVVLGSHVVDEPGRDVHRHEGWCVDGPPDARRPRCGRLCHRCARSAVGRRAWLGRLPLQVRSLTSSLPSTRKPVN